MNNTRRYELLKDWPDAKIGDTFQWNGQGYSNQTRTGRVLSKKYVEEYPDWFRPIEEKEFVWTDELVNEFVKKLLNEEFKKGESNFTQFKASKQNDVRGVLKKCYDTDGDGNCPMCINQPSLCPKYKPTPQPESKQRISTRNIFSIEDLEEAFEESRKTHPAIGFKHQTFSDYLKSLEK